MPLFRIKAAFVTRQFGSEGGATKYSARSVQRSVGSGFDVLNAAPDPDAFFNDVSSAQKYLETRFSRNYEWRREDLNGVESYTGYLVA